MLNSKLWRLFLTLSPTELKQFAWFLDSPYHNRRDDTKALFQALKEIRFDPSLAEKALIWKLIYPERDFSDADYRHLCSYLLHIIGEFLAINQFQKSHDLSVRKAEVFAARGLEDMAIQTVKQGRRKMVQSDGIKSNALLPLFLFERIDFRAHEREKRSFRPGLQGVSDALDRWYLVQKLQLACTMGSQKRVFQADYKLGLLEEVLAMAQVSPWKEDPLISLYYTTYELLQSQDLEIYNRQRSFLQQYAHLLSVEEKRTLSLMAINFCIRQINQGNSVFLEEVYQLYKLGLEEKWLFEQQQLSPWTYKNIVSAGLKLADFKWVGDFIQDFRSFLPEESRHTFHQYNLAELQFAQGDYSGVLKTLRFLRVKDPLTQLRARILQIKAGFELGDFQLIDSLLENLRKLLQRKKTLSYHREAYRNFERFLRRLMMAKPMESNSQFLLDLSQSEIVAEKEWLTHQGSQ